MLKIIKTLDQRDAQRALRAVIQQFLPSPDENRSSLDPVSRELLEELHAKLRIQPNDSSAEAPAKLFEALSEEMSKLLLTENREERARARLGNRGNLRPDLYKVSFDPSFTSAEARGVRRSHVEGAIREPDAIEHVPNPVQDLDNALTLITKKHRGAVSEHDFVLLVIASRREDTLRVVQAYRVYYSDVNLAMASSPTTVLKAFAETYGMRFTLGPIGPTRFVFNEVFAYEGKRSPTLMVLGDELGFREQAVATGLSALGVVHVPFAYAIDGERYTQDLRRHNVEISPTYGRNGFWRVD